MDKQEVMRIVSEEIDKAFEYRLRHIKQLRGSPIPSRRQQFSKLYDKYYKIKYDIEKGVRKRLVEKNG